jgi:hypothetical protein
MLGATAVVAANMLLLQVDAKNEATWSSWVQMEEDLGRLEAANELRIRSTEQQWEFVVPASFSTRTSAGHFGDGSNGLLQSLVNTLNRFFSVQAGGRSGASTVSNVTADASSSLGQQQLISELLPADYSTNLTLNDIIVEASASHASRGNGGPTECINLNDGGSHARHMAGVSLEQQQQQQNQTQQLHSQQPQQVVCQPREAPLQTSGGSILSSSTDNAVRRTCDGWQQEVDRAGGLTQRPVRPVSRD